MIRNRLQVAEAHVWQGLAQIAKQKGIVAKLEAGGHDATQARALLVQFEESQVLHAADRDRLRDELAAMI